MNEQIYGNWIDRTKYSVDGDRVIFNRDYECTNCHKHSTDNTKVCPNCGAINYGTFSPEFWFM